MHFANHKPNQAQSAAASTLPQHIAEIAVRAMLYEMACTPKPGLVDCSNNGAHQDMDFFLFCNGAAALAPGMYELALYGWNYRGQTARILPGLRAIGRVMEQALLRATGNINTQRGLLFSLGLACGVAARLARQSGTIQAEKLCAAIALTTKGISARELQALKRTPPHDRQLRPGEKAFLRYGADGARGEVERGLPTVRRHGLPALRKALARGCRMNDAALQALLCIMAKITDTNVLHRRDMSAMRWVRAQARAILAAGGVHTETGRAKLRAADKIFIRKNISPGGAADVLALTMAIFFWEKEVNQCRIHG